MKISKQVKELCEDVPVRLKKSDLEAIKKEVEASFTDILSYKNFPSLWSEIDAQNGYEDEWEAKKEYWKPYYEKVWKDAHKAAKPKPIKNKRYVAMYKLDDGRTVTTYASKTAGRWLIGGDVNNHKDVYIYSIDDEKIYRLKGSHLVPQDKMSDSQVKWFNDNWEEIRNKGMID